MPASNCGISKICAKRLCWRGFGMCYGMLNFVFFSSDFATNFFCSLHGQMTFLLAINRCQLLTSWRGEVYKKVLSKCFFLQQLRLRNFVLPKTSKLFCVCADCAPRAITPSRIVLPLFLSVVLILKFMLVNWFDLEAKLSTRQHHITWLLLSNMNFISL